MLTLSRAYYDKGCFQRALEVLSDQQLHLQKLHVILCVAYMQT